MALQQIVSYEVDFKEKKQKHDCVCNNFSRDYKKKYTKMNCWKKIAENFMMITENAENKEQNICTAHGSSLLWKILRTQNLFFSSPF